MSFQEFYVVSERGQVEGKWSISRVWINTG
jgi:hypothetical protein